MLDSINTSSPAQQQPPAPALPLPPSTLPWADWLDELASMLELEFWKLPKAARTKAQTALLGDQNARRNLGAFRCSGSCPNVVVTTTECRSHRKCRETRSSA